MFWYVEGKVSIAKTQLALHHFKEFFKNVIVDMNTVSWKKILFCFYYFLRKFIQDRIQLNKNKIK